MPDPEGEKAKVQPESFLDTTVDDAFMGMAPPELRLEAPRLEKRQEIALVYGGLIFSVVAVAGLVAVGILIYRIAGYQPNFSGGVTLQAVATAYATLYIAPFLLLVASSVASFIAFALLRTAGAPGREAVPPGDYDLLERLLADPKRDGVGEYVRLRSLTGVTGVFTKLGLTGLPLATIVLTCFFAAIGIYLPAFLDLAKLTLGAFLGSYVQRRAEDIVAGKDKAA